MITLLKVSGFKTLVDFKLHFTKGVNVLIGPNGVGKTNICSALSVLASMPNGELNDVLNQMGGVNSVFHKTNGKRGREFSISAEGVCEGVLNNIKSKEEYSVKYFYDFIVTLKRGGKIAIKEQLYIERKNHVDDYIGVIRVSKDEKKIKYTILNSELIGDHKLPPVKLSFDAGPSECLWAIMPRIFYVCHLVGRDLHRISAINIDPYIARQACDIIDPMWMSSNGKFLSNALYRLSKQEDRILEINSLLEQSIPCCSTIKPEVSQASLKRSFSLIDKNKNLFSANSISDGTIKLLGLLVGIIDQQEFTMIIEEPENYLHPNVLRLITEYLRETFNDGACIITTHSETILNLMAPNELIVCSYAENGTTQCKRIGEIKEVEDALNESGFGCGYHYVSGLLTSL